MTEVVDSDELLRRIQRARGCARDEERRWRARQVDLGPTDPEAAQEAAVRVLAYETVLRVLDEILTPGRHDAEG
ncbi:3-deoxy-D-manno-octulosonic acid transferase [Streptomyces sp. NPDC014864]|uniref:3-deoxy-D-manno-octulosonic acid transferase n=1 Tax=Streptomyces sp. NPDC014864 TaxID=3364924 RepID=UPI0036FA9107